MLSWIYGKITGLRNELYEREIFKSFSLEAKTVSVGNMTVGGTGKTPLVALIAEILAARGENVCVLTRGYGRANPKRRVLVSDGETVLTNAQIGGDEPFELANNLLGRAIVIADADRVAAARWARARFGATTFVLDDAFQHRRARRDLDVAVVDATNPFGNGKTLPSGILREPLKNLRRADVIVVSRANLIENADNLRAEIKKHNRDCPIFVCENAIEKLTELKVFTQKTRRNQTASKLRADGNAPNTVASKLEIEDFKPRTALAFCALGNPENFFAQMRRENFRLAAALSFPDHHFYAAKDIAKIEREAFRCGAEILLTTAKDAVKLNDPDFKIPCYVVEIGLRFDDEKLFRQTIESA